MAPHKTHYYVASGWDDDYVAGCHIETYEKTSRDMANVTCAFCIRNDAKDRALIEAEHVLRAQADQKAAP